MKAAFQLIMTVTLSKVVLWVVLKKAPGTSKELVSRLTFFSVLLLCIYGLVRISIVELNPHGLSWA